MSEQKGKSAKVFTVSSSPHVAEGMTSARLMYEVMIGMLPAMGMAVYLFGWAAAKLVLTCMVVGVATEWVFNAVRKRPQTVADGSVMVTGMILGLSLPPSLPFWAAGLGMIVAVAIAKMLFGGLGANIFNPAMVGRAFLMACFGMLMTTWTAPARVIGDDGLWQATTEATTQATPLAQVKQVIKDAHNPDKAEAEKAQTATMNGQWQSMFMGNVSGSVGETSALLWLAGGVFLLIRRTITYHIPLAVLGSALAIATAAWLIDGDVYANPLVHLSGGGLMMCAFFIATDPVSCPLSRIGRVIFGIGVGGLIMLIRLKGGYPEGVMYAVLLMNAMTPLLDRWTRPTPLGGHVRVG